MFQSGFIVNQIYSTLVVGFLRALSLSFFSSFFSSLGKEFLISSCLVRLPERVSNHEVNQDLVATGYKRYNENKLNRKIKLKRKKKGENMLKVIKTDADISGEDTTLTRGCS